MKGFSQVSKSVEKSVEPVVQSLNVNKEMTLANLSNGNQSLYPILSEYMGLDISSQIPKESNALVKPTMVREFYCSIVNESVKIMYVLSNKSEFYQ